MKTYPLFKVHVPTNDALAQIRVVFESGFINEGVAVTELMWALSQKLAAPHLVLTQSCTAALTLAMRLCGVGPGRDVVTTPMTCLASNAPIVTQNARVIWADIDPHSGMIDPASVDLKITTNTRAVVAVAWAGAPPDLGALSALCKKRGVALILDAAHAFLAEYRGRPIHEWADFTCYSFQAIKHFSTGDGGALICKASTDHQRAKALKWFGLDRDKAKDAAGNWKGQQWDRDVVEAGYKFNMNNIAAAIGLSQLPYIDAIMAAHRGAAEVYDGLFEGALAAVPVSKPGGGTSSCWVYTMRTTGRGASRDDLLARLGAEGIMAGLVHTPNDEYTAFADSRADLPGTRQFGATHFSLPCGWWLSLDDVHHIARRVLELSW